LAAISSVFAAGRGPAIASTKSATDHLLGAAGGLEAVFTALALRDGIAPATLNLIDPDVLADGLDLVALAPREMPIEHAMSNGFGGVNASVVLKHPA
jgi:3-oxoacyl-[acyl-carrier-protein] synthase II